MPRFLRSEKLPGCCEQGANAMTNFESEVLGRLRALDQIVILAIASASLLDPDPERFIRGLLVAARSNIRMINDRSDPAEKAVGIHATAAFENIADHSQSLP